MYIYICIYIYDTRGRFYQGALKSWICNMHILMYIYICMYKYNTRGLLYQGALKSWIYRRTQTAIPSKEIKKCRILIFCAFCYPLCTHTQQHHQMKECRILAFLWVLVSLHVTHSNTFKGNIVFRDLDFFCVFYFFYAQQYRQTKWRNEEFWKSCASCGVVRVACEVRTCSAKALYVRQEPYWLPNEPFNRQYIRFQISVFTHMQNIQVCSNKLRDPHVYIHTYVYTGWRRLIGSPKLQIIFHKRAIKYRSRLRKMICKDKGSYESSPPCTRVLAHNYVCTYTHMYTQMNTHEHTHARAHTHTHVHAHTHTHIRIYTCFWAHVYVCTYTHEHTPPPLHTHTPMYTSSGHTRIWGPVWAFLDLYHGWNCCSYIHIHVNEYLCTYTPIHTYVIRMHMHTYKHVCTCCIHTCIHVNEWFFSESTAHAQAQYSSMYIYAYGVATISRLLQMIGLFCKRTLWKRLYSAQETYDLKEPTNRSHPISISVIDSSVIGILLCIYEFVLFYRALLQKRPMILRSLLIVATPYVNADCKGHQKRGCIIHDATNYTYAKNYMYIHI